MHPSYESIGSNTPPQGPADENEFPSALFLSPEVFQHAQLEMLRPTVPINRDIIELVGGLADIRTTAETYFKMVHDWWPIISKRRFHRVLLNPVAQRRVELYLLTLSMKLSCLAAKDVNLSLYRTVKRFYSDLEVAGFYSIHLLQAAILIAIYEIGHAIYPAAFLSIGACARYAVLLGLDQDESPRRGQDLSFDEIEERRRAWWGVLVLDRYV